MTHELIHFFAKAVDFNCLNKTAKSLITKKQTYVRK